MKKEESILSIVVGSIWLICAYLIWYDINFIPIFIYFSLAFAMPFTSIRNVFDVLLLVFGFSWILVYLVTSLFFPPILTENAVLPNPTSTFILTSYSVLLGIGFLTKGFYALVKK